MKHKSALLPLILIFLAIATGGCGLAKHEKKAAEDAESRLLKRSGRASNMVRLSPSA